MGDYMSDFDKKKHTLSMENRESITLTGVSDVESFNEDEVMAVTDYGNILIKGSSLSVEVLDLQTGNLSITGTISALVYSTATVQKGFFKKVFS